MYTSLSESLSLPLEYLKKTKKNYSPLKKMMLIFQRDRREVDPCSLRSLQIPNPPITIQEISGRPMFNIKRGEQTRWRTCKEVWKGKKAYFPRRNLFR